MGPARPGSAGATAADDAVQIKGLRDGTPITDSTAIIQYLADRHGALTHPAGTLERARQDSLTQFLLDEFDAVLWTAARHTFILPEELRVSAIKQSLRWEFQRSQKTLGHRASDRDFLMGDEMTVPDVILTHCLGWAQAAKFPIAEAWLSDYHARMQQRPGFQRAAAR